MVNKSYPDNIALASPLSWLIERFAGSAERTAFIHEGRSVQYGDVIALVRSFRSLLAARGIGSGERVVMWGDYSPEIFCMMLALAQNGNIIIPLTGNSVVTVDSVLEVCGCDWYLRFTPDSVTPRVEPHRIEVENTMLSAFRACGSAGLILFSSGSTGTPKGMLYDFVQVTEKFRKPRGSTIAIPFLMIDHFGGINTILAITASLGTVVTVADRSVSQICAAIERYKVELLPTTPSFLALLMASGLDTQFDLSSLKRISYGTEVMAQSTLDRLCNSFPHVRLLQTYGLSEVGVLRSESRADGSLWVRIGGDGFSTKIVDDVLWIKSNFAMIGYLNAPSGFDSDGYFNTQDKVEVDGEYFRILGRVTDIINVGGSKVYPSEVESAILGVENVRDVAVFGESNALLGQIVVAKVVLDTPEALDSVKKRIRRVCLAKLASYKVPAKVILTEGLLHSVRQKKIRRA